MRRALILIVSLSILTFGCGTALDALQQRTATRYLQGMQAVRQLVVQRRMADALREQAYWHALWQHDSGWLNCLISHHHTRAVNAGMLALTTALEMGWQVESMLALDEICDALMEIAVSNLPLWENIL